MDKEEQSIIDLYQQLPQQQPSSQLDRKILSAANEAISPKKSKSKRYLWVLSSVAVVVLSVNVALKLVIQPTALQAPFEPIIKHEDIPAHINEAMSEEINDPQMAQFKEIKQKQRQQTQKKSLAKRKMTKEIKRSIDVPNKIAQLPIAQVPNLQESFTQPAIAQPAIAQSEITQLKSTQPNLAQSTAAQSPIIQSPKVLFKKAKRILSDEIYSLKQAPYFEFNVKKLNSRFPTLQVTQNSDDHILIQHDSKLILKLKLLIDGSINITAYPQKNDLNLKIDWNLRSTCHLNNSVHQCPISSTLIGHYKNSKLVMVTWTQQK